MEIKNNTEFYEAIKSSKLTVVDFNASWCGPCKMLAPVFKAVSEKFVNKVNFLKVDIDQFNDIAGNYKIQIVPTILYFKNGQEVAKTTGYTNEEALIDKINSLLN